MVPRIGFEPTTYGLGIRCSVLLSYRGVIELLIMNSKLRGGIYLNFYGISIFIVKRSNFQLLIH